MTFLDNVTLTATAAIPVPVQTPGFVSSGTQTRPADTTAYTALDVVGTIAAANISLANIGSIQASYFTITGVTLEFDINAVPSGMGNFRLHLFDAAPTAIADNDAFNLIAADRAKYLGYITLGTPVDLGDTLISCTDTLNFRRKLASASTTIYGVLQTVDAFTPVSEAVMAITINGHQS